MDRDFYEILGVARDADQDTIKKAYRKLAMQFHPDRNPDNPEAEEKFKEAARAYEVLSNQEKRARYDRFGHAGVNGGMGGGPQFHDVGDIFSAFGDIFGDIFGGGARSTRGQRNRPSRGADLRYVMELELEEVLIGADRPIQFKSEAECKSCEGRGAEKGHAPEICGQCGGSGQVVRSQGFFSMASTCPVCRGRGEVIKNPCRSCHGSGRSVEDRKIEVHVPAGVHTGTQLRLSNEGEGGYRGGPPGDLYVEIRVREHERFEREEDDLIGRLKISYLQALLGGEVEVLTLTSPKKLTIPRGTADGDVLKLEGEGLPHLRGRHKGDLRLEVEVEIPTKLLKEEEKLLREIADLKKESVGPEPKGFFRR